MIIHLGTQIVSMFGRLDENGDVVERYRAVPNNGTDLPNLTEETFLAAQRELVTLRNQLVEKYQTTTKGTEEEPAEPAPIPTPAPTPAPTPPNGRSSSSPERGSRLRHDDF